MDVCVCVYYIVVGNNNVKKKTKNVLHYNNFVFFFSSPVMWNKSSGVKTFNQRDCQPSYTYLLQVSGQNLTHNVFPRPKGTE